MRQSYIAEPNKEYDGRWVGPGGDILVEVTRTNNARDLRGALLALAFALRKEVPTTKGLLVLADSKLSAGRLAGELDQFRSIVKDEVGNKIHLVAFDEGSLRMKGLIPDINEDLALFIHDLVRHDASTQGGRVSRVFVQSLVIDRWLQGRAMTSSLEVKAESGASKPTVLAALEQLMRLDVIFGDGGDFSIRPPGWEAWESMAMDLRSERKPIHFADPSGLARSPAELLKRLVKIKGRKKLDVAVSGVMAAYHFYEELNITAPPRLDLSVYNGDFNFVRQLDAGLLEMKNLKAHAPLVLHLGRRLRPPSRFDSADLDEASPLECMADLLDLGLTAEAQDFAHHLNRSVAPGGALR